MKLAFYAFMAATLAFDILGDLFAKKWSIDNQNITLILLMVFYATSGLLWGISLKHGELSKGTMIINLLNVLAIVIVGLAIYKEQLTTQNKIGVILGIISLYLINKD